MKPYIIILRIGNKLNNLFIKLFSATCNRETDGEWGHNKMRVIKTVLFIIHNCFSLFVKVDVVTFDDTTSSNDIKLHQWTES